MKILVLSYKFFPDIGGIETISEIVANAFLKAGHEIKLLTVSFEKTKKVFPFVVTRKPGIFKLFQLYAWADIIFENNPSIRLSWPTFFLNKPSIVVLQTWISPLGSHKLIDKLKSWRLKKASGVIGCSEAIRTHCWPKAVVIGNPYNEDLFRTLDNVKKIKDFIFLGRLVSDKGADLAVKAFAKIVAYENKLFSNLKLTIVGDGPEKKTLEKLIMELKLEKHVFIKGSLTGEDLVICLNEHRFILVPSVWEEPFGIVVLEGMACGCVPIVSNGGGLPDAVGKAGLTFKSGDVHSLTMVMKAVVENPSDIQKLKQEAISHLEAHTSKKISIKYLMFINNFV